MAAGAGVDSCALCSCTREAKEDDGLGDQRDAGSLKSTTSQVTLNA